MVFISVSRNATISPFLFSAGSLIRVCCDQPVTGGCHAVGSDFLPVGQTG
jgi:hypothetical protein